MLWSMTTLFNYVPHPHIEARKASGPPKVAAAVAQVHGSGVFGRLNAKVGLRITIIVGTMWAAYLFALLAFISLPSTIKQHSATVLEPELAARVARIEADAAQRLPPTVRTAFDVAPVLVLLADPRAAVGTGLVNHRAYFPASACSRAPLASTS